MSKAEWSRLGKLSVLESISPLAKSLLFWKLCCWTLKSFHIRQISILYRVYLWQSLLYLSNLLISHVKKLSLIPLCWRFEFWSVCKFTYVCRKCNLCSVVKYTVWNHLLTDFRIFPLKNSIQWQFNMCIA